MALEQKELDQEPGAGVDSSLIRIGASCQNPGCDAVIDVEQSSVSLMPSRVEISLVKADPGSWAQLEHPDALAEKAKAEVGLEMDEEESEDSDDDLSWTEEEEEEAMGE
ncbi:hypothetical protein MJG53_019780 [Ovis ammon polii x Ovis aries]|uniref:Uncharacterized protein n=1 Tax=Ovis ammon polii x Ovis aries TaxID=2918886 RepID=A0ACB9U0G5_9CETA|nr:hypothetical protein MJG53_019780 [Ovis ammon polii x Ovis aries]